MPAAPRPRPTPARRRRAPERAPAADLPVARVAVDLPLAHLDRPFDYLVDERLATAVVPGSRVRVRFSGQLVDGYVLERTSTSDHEGRLSYVERSVSSEPALTPEVAGLARAVADHWGGTLADVLRLAVPPRHAQVEAEPVAAPPATTLAAPGAGGLARYPGGARLVADLAAGAAPRAVWAALPGDSWPADVATLVAATLASGRGAVVVVPDARDVGRADAALGAALGHGRHVALTAGLGPAERYRRFLAVRRGAVQAVVGTRAAVWAPVSDLGLVVVWDDGDDLHAEPRAPYAHARDVAVLRAHRAGAAAVIGGFAVTAEGAALVRRGWARGLAATRETVRAVGPHVHAAGDDADLARDAAARAARLPSVGWETLHDGLRSGPVLVQVPRRGYQPALACAECRTAARCAQCSGPLARSDESRPPTCRWCGAPATTWRCPQCSGDRLRAVVVGARRTAEELGRAFPGRPVRTSGGDGVLATVSGTPTVVVATPGAEPVADGGYAAALLLDGWALLSRPDLRAGEEALRRWLNAAALVRPGGRVVVVADSGLPAVQALVRWQPAWHAERELDERAALGFPPATRMASMTGAPAAVAELLEAAALPPGTDVLGPVPVPGADGDATERLLLRVPRARGGALAAALKAAQAVRSARKAGESVRVQLDPLELV